MSDGKKSIETAKRSSNTEHQEKLTCRKWRRSFWSFLAVYMIFALTHGVQGSYVSSILTTLERKFKLPSIVAGTVVTFSSLGYMTSALLVSFFLPNRLRVKAFACSMLCTGLCSIVYALPHFLYATIREDSITKNTTTTDVLNSHQNTHSLCSLANTSFTNAGSDLENSAEVDHAPNWTAVMLFCISEILHGIAGAPIWTIGISMIDDHTPVNLASKLIGFMFFMRFLSPVLSFSMGSLFLTFPDDLKESSMTTTDPEWIGAWWLGFMVCFVVNISISLPTFFLANQFEKVGAHKISQEEKKKEIVFDYNGVNDNEKIDVVVGGKLKALAEENVTKNEVSGFGIDQSDGMKDRDVCINGDKILPQKQGWNDEKEKNNNEKQRDEKEILKNNEKLSDEEKVVIASEAIDKSNEDDDDEEDDEELCIKKRSFKELFLTVDRLLKNPTFTIISIGVCFDCFVLPFYSFLPKYVEVHFKQTAWKASLLGGMVPALAGGVMSYGGGVISGKFKASQDRAVNSNVKFSLAMCVLASSMMISLIFIPCLHNFLPYGYDQATKSVSINNTCNTDCECDVGVFDPVCGDDGDWYVSPCQAACRQYSEQLNIYSNCSCIAEAPQTAKAGYCDGDCESMVALYVTCMVVFCFCINSYNVAITNATLKCVPKRDKPVALALQTIFICITLFPSPLLYGGFIDRTCILWQTSADNDSTGSCLAYHHYYFRIALHGCLFACRIVVILLYSLAFFFSRRELNQIQNQIKKELSIIIEVK